MSEDNYEIIANLGYAALDNNRRIAVSIRKDKETGTVYTFLEQQSGLNKRMLCKFPVEASQELGYCLLDVAEYAQLHLVEVEKELGLGVVRKYKEWQ